MIRADRPARLLVPPSAVAIAAAAIATLPTLASPRVQRDAVGVEEMRLGATRWLASWVHDRGFGPTVEDAALLVAALDRDPRGEFGAEVGTGRAWLRERQREGGSFGDRPETARVGPTWTAVAAFAGATAEQDRSALGRAMVYLEAAERADSAAIRVSPRGSGGVRGALEFLQASGTEVRRGYRAVGEPGDMEAVELYAFAQGSFRIRDAYRLIVDRGCSPDGALIRWLDRGQREGALQVCNLTARVLARYRSATVATPRGTVFWPEIVLGEVRLHWTEGEGAFSNAAGGPADPLATASALLALEVLSRWTVLSPASLSAAEGSEPARTADLRQDCEGCHAELQPGLHHQWQTSAHAAAGVGCGDCHGFNHSQTFREEGRVSPAVCARCHPKAARQFERSLHARAEEKLFASSLFRATPDAARASCVGCHRIGYRHADGTRGTCNSCHSGHRFSAASAREPGACTVCHVGEDYPQELAYRLSEHGTLYESTSDPLVAPTCATCHMPDGNHDDGFGITIGGSGVGGVAEGDEAPIPIRPVPREVIAPNRAEMIRVCSSCHSSRFARENLEQADRIKREGDRFLAEAVKILRELETESLLCSQDPEGLRLGGEQLLVDPASPGSALLDRFYRMWRFHYTASWKGAYHGSHSVANQQSRPGLEQDLAFIRAEAARLRKESLER